MTAPQAPNRHEVTATEPIFAGRVITVRRDRVRMGDGQQAWREVVAHPGAVGILALDDEDQVVLVTQYRHPVGRDLDELPAGLLDVAGEPALAAAQRELAEEAGLQARDWHVLLDLLTSPGSSTEAIRVFLARGLSAASAAGFVAADEEATMTVRRIPLAEAVRRSLSGELSNAVAVAGVLAAAEGVRTGWAGLRAPDAPWPDRPQQ
jgi:8-oxo-dGDP phosphatase